MEQNQRSNIDNNNNEQIDQEREKINKIEKISKVYPFLTFFDYDSEHYVGIIQTVHDKIAMVYVYNLIREKNLQQAFLRYGEIWWWESSRNYPINLFLKGKFDIFSFCLKSFNYQNMKIIMGPRSMSSTLGKESKRKQIFSIVTRKQKSL